MSTRPSELLSIAAVVMLVAALSSVSPAGATNDVTMPSGLSVTYQTPDEALRQDLELTAEARGWSYDQAVAQYRAAQEVGAIAAVVYQSRPETFIASALSDEPGGPPILYQGSGGRLHP